MKLTSSQLKRIINETVKFSKRKRLSESEVDAKSSILSSQKLQKAKDNLVNAIIDSCSEQLEDLSPTIAIDLDDNGLSEDFYVGLDRLIEEEVDTIMNDVG